MVDTVQLSRVYDDGEDRVRIWIAEVMRRAPVWRVEDGMVAVRRGKRGEGRG